MSPSRNVCGALLLLIAMASSAAAQPTVMLGKALFQRDWSIGDPLSPSGDGLGPMRNARSCAECHKQGGLGGGGPVTNNVDILTPAPRSALNRAGLGALHPAFLASGDIPRNIVVHRLGNNPAYLAQRERLLRQADYAAQDESGQHPTRISYEPARRLTFAAGLELFHTQRNTPALFGAGLINRIPPAAIHLAARRQAAMKGPIHGSVPKVGKKVGRFGWRGQTVSLNDFVVAACANELGLSSKDNLQAINPQRPKDKPAGLDLNALQTRSLTAFVSSLPAPRRLIPSDPQQRQAAQRGEKLFGKLGCAICHQPRMAHVAGLYSDMLLHDMGERLADSIATYYGSSNSGSRLHWRTPPLWGVRDSAPYMHDGRAATLAEAILLHGGEADAIRLQFLAMSLEDRLALIAFLNTLAAPAQN